MKNLTVPYSKTSEKPKDAKRIERKFQKGWAAPCECARPRSIATLARNDLSAESICVSLEGQSVSARLTSPLICSRPILLILYRGDCPLMTGLPLTIGRQILLVAPDAAFFAHVPPALILVSFCRVGIFVTSDPEVDPVDRPLRGGLALRRAS